MKIYRFLLQAGTITACLVAAGLAVMVAVSHHAANTFSREKVQWQQRTHILAQAHAQNIQRWIVNHQAALTGMADHLSLRLYVTELAKASSPALDEAQLAERQFLQHYLQATAQQSGFLSRRKATADIPANFSDQKPGGITLLGAANRPLLTTKDMAPLSPPVMQQLERTPMAEEAFVDGFLAEDGTVYVAFITPIQAVQSEEIVGRIVAVRALDPPFYALLHHPPAAAEGAYSLLLRPDPAGVRLLSPTAAAPLPLAQAFAIDKQTGIETKLLHAYDSSFAEGINYAGTKVIASAAKVEGTPWQVQHGVPYASSLAKSAARQTRTIALGIVAVLLTGVAMLALWRHSSSLRYQRLSAQFASQAELLKLIANQQPDPIFITDQQGIYRYANAAAAEDVQMKEPTLAGKPLIDVMGRARAQQYLDAQKEMLKTGKRLSQIQQREGKGKKPGRVIQTEYVALPEIPDVLTQGQTLPGMLVVEYDITDIMHAKEKQARLLDQLIETLILAVDKRDAHHIHHSRKVKILAGILAREMKLDDIAVETVSIAGSVLNFGKMLLPAEILTKKRLTAKERTALQQALQTSVTLLAHLPFEGPVVQTIEQSQERVDGKGPLKLAQKDILPTAQIVQLANHFIAMTSPRAYREALANEAVIAALMEEVGTRYSRKLVIALVHYLENQTAPYPWEV